MGSLKRKYGQRNRRAKETVVGAIIDLLVFILKWTIFLPFTLIIMMFRKGRN